MSGNCSVQTGMPPGAGSMSADNLSQHERTYAALWSTLGNKNSSSCDNVCDVQTLADIEALLVSTLRSCHATLLACKQVHA